MFTYQTYSCFVYTISQLTNLDDLPPRQKIYQSSLGWANLTHRDYVPVHSSPDLTYSLTMKIKGHKKNLAHRKLDTWLGQENRIIEINKGSGLCQVLAEEFAAEHLHVPDNVVVKRFEKREKYLTIQSAWWGVMCWMRGELDSTQGGMSSGEARLEASLVLWLVD